MSKHFFESFTNQFQLSKTLRFELVPQGKTLENIETKGLLVQDQNRAKSYQEMKKTIDEYHKWFIELALKNVELENLNEYARLYYTPKDNRDDAAFTKVKSDLRKEIVKKFSEGEAKEKFKNLFAKELIKEDLETWIKQNKPELFFDEEFKNFTTYFLGFHENRKNMYSAEEQGTAIAYRIVHENLPKFLDNVKLYEQLAKLNDLDLSPILLELGESLQEFQTLEEIKSLDQIFDVSFFSKVLSQNGIDFINLVIGGRSEKPGELKIKGLNEYINLYNQQQTDKKKKQLKFKQLYKQILSDRTSASFLLEAYKDDEVLFDSVNNYYKACLLNAPLQGFQTLEGVTLESVNVLTSIQDLLAQIATLDLDKIHLRNDVGLTAISQKMFGDYGVFKAAMSHRYETVVDSKFQSKLEKVAYESDAHKKLLKQKTDWKKDYISIQLLQTCLDEYISFQTLQGFKTLEELKGGELKIADYFKTHFSFEKDNGKRYNFVSHIQEKYQPIEGLLNIAKEDKHRLKQEPERIHQLKEFLDSILALLHFVKPLYCKDDSISEKDGNFYNDFEVLYKELDKLTPLYNMVRNYVTQKPYETTKVKLNFENAQLLKGWDQNKETDNTSILLRKDGLYYLAIMNKKANKVFENAPKAKSEEVVFEKMNYKYFPDASKMIPKCSTQLKEVKKHFEKSNSNIELKGGKIVETLTISKRVFELNNVVFDEKTKSLKFKDGDADDTKSPKMFQKKYLVLTADEQGYKQALTDWIDFAKDFLTKYESTQQFKYDFKASSQYKSLDEFYGDIDTQTYKITFENIPESYISDKVDKGELYLFKIYNKDFSEHSKGTPNIHTLYWKMLFDEQNLKDVVYKLNGEAEVFFRKSSILAKNVIVHPEKIKIAKKFFKNGEGKTIRLSDLVVKRLNEFYQGKIRQSELTKEELIYLDNYSLFFEGGKNIDIIKDRRYTVAKFQFHVPITMNFKAEGTDRINEEVNRFLQNNPDVNIIGLDRGERHLIYLTLINQKGEILKQESLNTIKSEKHKIETPYHTLLDTKEKQRDDARKEWGTIEGIKTLKEGYISQVVHKIATMMLENNAIVVMEDLNSGFKRGRFHVEKQVYQKLEKMLIDKLNYLVFKDKNKDEVGGVMKALQLTESYKDFMKYEKKQCGFIFYVPAWNTSKIDPATGFVDFLKPRYESVQKSQEFFEKFKSISFNKEKERFEFVFDYTDFTNRAEGSQTKWTVCADNQTRYFFNKQLNQNKGAQEGIEVCKALEDLFREAGITYGNGANIKDQIVAQTSTGFFKKLLKYLATTLSLRHNNGLKGVEEQDFILSSVAVEASNHQGFKNLDGLKVGEFFDSRKATDKQPKDADANGAYHIALKGLWVLDQLGKAKDLNKPNLVISNKDWLAFAQKKAF